MGLVIGAAAAAASGGMRTAKLAEMPGLAGASIVTVMRACLNEQELGAGGWFVLLLLLQVQHTPPY